MTDILTKKQRSYCMSRIRSSETKPEMKIRNFMKMLGFRYQPKGIVGKPDFADRKRKVAVFVDGCFWHKCTKHYIAPKQNKDFWKNKIEKNVRRDKEIKKILEKKGWKVVRIWEHYI